jgi:D-glycerate 3-kinase
VTSATEQRHIPQWQEDFIQRHRLDTAYLETAHKWFAPLVQKLVAHQKSAKRPILVALNGCQGSGKTTVCDFLRCAFEAEHQLHAVALSLDDFYLTREQRQALADSVNPLLATRGVPGTHDMALLRQTLEQLLDSKRSEPVAIPRFDKSVDDRHPASHWDYISSPVQIILLEGWCLGAQAQPTASLSRPINALEETEDAGGHWRNYSNTLLGSDFHALYTLVDQWIMLRAPSFECVFQWRREQEQKLAATLPSGQAHKLMNDDALLRFIQHYERITRQCLELLPDKVNHLFELNRERQIVAYTHREQAGDFT